MVRKMLEGQKCLVIGSGISGIGAVALLEKYHADVVLYDSSDKLTKEDLEAKLPGESKAVCIAGELPEEVEPVSYTHLVIESLFGKGYFDVVQGQVDGVPIKPDPAGVFRILEQFGLNADEVLYMGDTATDMKTGKAAGAFTVGVLWGFRDRKELEEGHADAIIAHPLELLKYCE